MRTWGRILQDGDLPGKPTKWIEVKTDENGLNDDVYLTTMIQVLKLNLNESPFYATYGIPAHQAVIQQVFPDWFIWQVQRQFAPYFASLLISKLPDTQTPRYKIDVTTNAGRKVNLEIAT